MSVTKAEVLKLARELPPDELTKLVEELSDVVHPPPGPPMTAAEFRAELDRR
jgi:hypothetical protein